MSTNDQRNQIQLKVSKAVIEDTVNIVKKNWIVVDMTVFFIMDMHGGEECCSLCTLQRNKVFS